MILYEKHCMMTMQTMFVQNIVTTLGMFILLNKCNASFPWRKQIFVLYHTIHLYSNIYVNPHIRVLMIG